MLEPNNRSLYTSALTPPSGMIFDEAIATTFSLDPTALLGVPVHLALLAGNHKTQEPDAIAILESMRRFSDKITVYAQLGHLSAPSQSGVLNGLLASMVYEVTAPGGGVFHPKLWVIRFTDPTGSEPPLFRLMVLSRNLTFDRSWDLALQLEGRPGVKNRTMNRGLSELIAKLPELSVNKVPGDRRLQAKRISDEVRKADWELPSGFDSVSFKTIGLKPGAWSPEYSNKMAIISPFCEEGALDRLRKMTSSAEVLISRPETLTGFNPDTRGLFSKCMCLHEAAETQDGESCGDESSKDTIGLHAKAYIFERGWDTHIVVGSANATNAALTNAKNVEVLVELVGKRSKVGGIDNLLGDDGLGEVLEEFIPPDEMSEVDIERKDAENALDEARNKLALANLRVRCDKSETSSEWRLSLTGELPFLDGVKQLKAWPITVPEQRAQDLDLLQPPKAIDTQLGIFSPAYLTGFIAFDMSSTFSGLSVRFTRNLPIDGLPEERDAEIWRIVLDNHEGFIKYLRMLLASYDDELSSANTKGGWDYGFAGSFYNGGELLEDMTRALCHNPNKLQEVDKVVARIYGSTDYGTILTPDFLQTWNVFRKVMEDNNG